MGAAELLDRGGCGQPGKVSLPVLHFVSKGFLDFVQLEAQLEALGGIQLTPKSVRSSMTASSVLSMSSARTV
jgi:hypothetical protein